MTRTRARKIASILDSAVEAMNGDEGAHWIKGRFVSEYPLADGRYGYCSLGAIDHVSDVNLNGYDERDEAVRALRAAYGAKGYSPTSIAEWNDAETTTWKDVKRRFVRARNNVLREAGLKK
jgi:hypothetical protein